jgi:hypothetical protein
VPEDEQEPVEITELIPPPPKLERQTNGREVSTDDDTEDKEKKDKEKKARVERLQAAAAAAREKKKKEAEEAKQKEQKQQKEQQKEQPRKLVLVDKIKRLIDLGVYSKKSLATVQRLTIPELEAYYQLLLKESARMVAAKKEELKKKKQSAKEHADNLAEPSQPAIPSSQSEDAQPPQKIGTNLGNLLYCAEVRIDTINFMIGLLSNVKNEIIANSKPAAQL